jgi:hypothetical protein
MKPMGIMTLLVHALVIWALCTAVMGIGMTIMPIDQALIVHAVAAPIIATVVSFLYFMRFSYTTPIQTAIVFVMFVVIMDFFVIALAVQGSLEMFTSLIGTWIPFGLIFAASYLTGFNVNRSKHMPVSKP